MSEFDRGLLALLGKIVLVWALLVALLGWVIVNYPNDNPRPNFVEECHSKRGTVIYNRIGTPEYCAVPPSN